MCHDVSLCILYLHKNSTYSKWLNSLMIVILICTALTLFYFYQCVETTVLIINKCDEIQYITSLLIEYFIPNDTTNTREHILCNLLRPH